MALPMLVGSAECGPSNPLQGLTKRFDQDRGVQQDIFGGARAGASREGFRSQQAGPSATDRNDAAQFFNQSSRTPGFQVPDTFQMGALHGALPHLQDAQLHKASDAGWAADFMLQQPASASTSNTQLASPPSVVHGGELVRSPPPQQSASPIYSSGGVMPWNSGMPTWATRSMPSFAPQINRPVQQVEHSSKSFDYISWDKEFDSHQLLSTTKEHLVISEPMTRSPERPQDADELARTAGLLLDTVREEQNPKFQSSQFMSLMTQLRDRKVVVEGNQFVENTGQTSTDIKGKGKAVDAQPFIYNGTGMGSMSMTGTSSILRDEQSGTLQDDENDTYFRQENAEYTRFWNEMNSMQGVSSRQRSQPWDALQDSWDLFEASEKGIRPVMHYKFQENNPYMRGEARTRHHMIHSDERLESVLELEAVVQHDPSNAQAWFGLGVKQQENEREQKALLALQRAVELDPTHLPSWLALAVSYTNDGYRLGTYESVKEWVMRNDKYRATVQSHLRRFPNPQDASVKERFDSLKNCLVAMVQQSAGDDLDADIQIALGVLFYTEEDYTKAEDCFLAALSVRPNDWLLYNRVGATTANRGQADAALYYYNHALDLNPGYIRARYNLGISYINLRRYAEAAEHILNALQLQEADSTQGSDGMNEDRGITSTTLWDSLKTASLHMERHDLASLCDRRDLEGMRL
ncbi:peroxisomal targeting signal 1 receptor [Moniliophthora roreri MCA 2997]|uniref:Peroxisomal targeting signal 1 receptor n=1 Tax=Moniliophthora roreri (strain MCA 2997) TaxID=1381753 RepID=V2XUN4_MONRO|nr:peroxisomal targeting signal 1 receptor [Moniliophthora roreri MCA 2997]